MEKKFLLLAGDSKAGKLISGLLRLLTQILVGKTNKCSVMCSSAYIWRAAIPFFHLW